MTTQRSVPHIHYVAFSRAKTMSGLHITELQDDKISVDNKVLVEMGRLRTQSFDLCYIPIYNFGSDTFVVAFNNIRSLNLHFQDVVHSKNVTAADVVAFSETRLKPYVKVKDIELNGVRLFRNDKRSATSLTGSFHGTAAYIFRIFPVNIKDYKILSTKCECLKLYFQ